MKYIIIWVGVFCLMSCRKELDIELPFEGSKLVVESFLSPDKVITLKLNKTYPVIGKQLFVDGITNAQVDLYENNLLIETLKYQNKGIYFSVNNTKPKTGFSYYYKIKAEGFADVESIPEKIPVELKNYQGVFDEPLESLYTNGAARKLQITINDIKDEDNFYSIRVWGEYKGNVVGGSWFRLGQIEDVGSFCGFTRAEDFISDECFKNNKITLSYAVGLNGTLQSSEINKPTYNVKSEKIIVYFSTLSKATYRYYETENEGSDFFQAFNAPVKQYSNIKGGYGIVAAFTQSKIEFLVK